MKRELQQIYRELSAGTLSQEQALAKLRQGASIGTLLASTAWERADVQGDASRYEQHHVILCNLPRIDVRELEASLPQVRCETLAGDRSHTIADRYTTLALACFESIQRIFRSKPRGQVLLQIVIGEVEDATVFAGLAGLLETAAQENPGITGQIIFTRSDITTNELAQRVQAECRQALERLVSYADETRRVRRWKPIETRAASPGLFKEGGVYLITGGLGGLGVLFTREIQRQTARARVILTGRSPLTAEKQALLSSLQQSAHAVEYRQIDVADLDAVSPLIGAIVREHGQLNGILHAAGVVRDDFVLKKTDARFREVLQPKVAGTYNLDVSTSKLALDFFVLCSSIASWCGNPGQVDYAAANGFMDQFAAVRNRRVLAGERQGRTLSLLWPHWLEGGMSTDAASMEVLRTRTGMGSLDTQSAMQALYHCVASEQSHVLVMRGDIAQMRRVLNGEQAQMMEQRQMKASDRAPVASADAQGQLAEKTREFLRGELAAMLKMPVSKVDARAPLEAYGIDSIMAMSLTRRLEETFGVLAKTLFFEYLTLDELAGYFVESHAPRLSQLFAVKNAEPAPVAAQARQEPSADLVVARRSRRSRRRPVAAEENAGPATSFNSEPIAIVGLSGRYPESRDLAAFWRNLRDGNDCIVEIPSERWDWKQHYSEDRTRQGAHFSRWGGFIEGVDEFDPRFFNIAPREAHGIDPQERLFLQHAWMAIEDAGYTRASLQIAHENRLPGQVGVYAGVMYGEYNVSGSLASIANRVSYFLNLHGPSLTLDTMCSSSLTAIHLACQDLRLGRTSLGIAGGVNVSIHPNKYAMLSGGQFISTDGHCQSFGEGGDGYIPGEGVGVAILKRLSDAVRDGNHIHGVIRGSALNHGGKTNGYTVPNPQAQADVIRQALSEANLSARHVSYIEAHGTGTKLGDPIEIAALSKAFNESVPAASRAAGFCRIGSAKSNIGHCESAAGIAGVTKVLLQMKHQQIVPSLHSSKLNPHIDFAATPFVVNQSLMVWEQPEVAGQRVPRIAGISSFGAGGSNAHVIIEEYVATEESQAASTLPVIVPLSARTAQALRERAQDLLAVLRENSAIDMAAVAYTLQVGREAMEERAGFIAASTQELIARIDAFLHGDVSIEGVSQGQAKQHKDTLAALTDQPDFQAMLDGWIGARDLQRLLDLWVKGWDLDWRRLVTGVKPPRFMSLPTYPFARERYWTQPATIASPSVQTTAAVLHPLVHENTSSFDLHRYTSRFNGNETFLESAAGGSKHLPWPVALEMIQAALELSSSQRTESGGWVLEEIVSGDPIDVTGGTTLHIGLFPQEQDRIDVEIYNSSDDLVHLQAHAIFQVGLQREPSTPAVASSPAVTSEPREIPLAPSPIVARHDKPTRIRLVDAAEMNATALTASKSIVSLPTLTTTLSEASTHTNIRLLDLGNGVFAIEVGEGALSHGFDVLAQALHRAAAEPALKVLILDGTSSRLWSGDRATSEHGLFTAVAHFPYPVIAALPPEAADAGLMLGAVCDFMTCSEDGRYGFTDASAAEARFLRERLGDQTAAALLDKIGPWSGRDLKSIGWACRIVRAEEVESSARQLASSLAQKSQLALRLLKAHLARYMLPLVEDFAAGVDASFHVEVADPFATAAASDAPVTTATPVSIPLRSSAVSLSAYSDGVVLMQLHDRQAKNLFSEALVSGLKEAFAHIEQTLTYKVVILTGYDSYFVTGGTQETLLAIQKGEVQFTDEKAFQLPMECRLPVIAAMQGHAIGGGWSFGMFADIPLLSEESRYRSPYMSYGFTPGAGSTLVFPKKIGYDLARETLLTGHEMSGAELKERGIGLRVLPRRQVVSAAMALAQSLAREPRHQLIQWKEASARSLRELSEETYARELAMHQQTFVGQAETLANIQQQFSTEMVESAPTPIASAAPQVSAIALPTVIAKLRELLAQELHLAPEEIDENAQFIDLGLDSITGVTWIRRINEHYGTSIEATKVYSQPTLAQLGHHVQQEAEKTGKFASTPAPAPVLPESVREVLVPAPRQQQIRVAREKLVSWRFRDRPSPKPATSKQTADAPQAIAVIGMAGQFAKANDLEQFWDNLRAGRNCIEEIPAQRWSLQDHFREGAATPGKTYSKWLGALEEYDRFDPLFFNISPTEATSMDPQQRLFLQTCWHSIENAGYDPRSLSGSECGVFVGCGPTDYHQVSREQQLSAQAFTGAATSILAARISYFLNLRGPCISIDTACSSSLVAIAQACDSLNSGNSAVALAGGVYVMSGPAMHIMTSQAGMLSADGRCFTFDKRANGFVPGEGVGVVMLKRLADAERDGDRIAGVIEGWGINQDGKTNGITAPNEDSQARLMQSVYRKFGIDPAGIQLIEAHGTGTSLGDPIEVAGLKAAFAEFTDRSNYCALGSVKSNIGHCLTAAGSAGIIKLLLAMKHRSLPPTVHYENCNEHIRLAGSPFYINDSLKPWNVAVDERRRAAISSFGFSGTNAHIVLAEYVPAMRVKATPPVVSENSKIMVCLSARTESQLRQKAVDLLALLRRRTESVDLRDLAYTLHVGREQMAERLGFLVGTRDVLTNKLDRWVAGEQGIEDVYQGQVKRNKEAVRLLSQDDEMRAMVIGKWLSERKLSKLLDLWVKGIDLDWTLLYGTPKPQRVELPNYPFAKDRFWIEATAPAVASSEFIHPLLHRNTSVLGQQRYSSVFSGEEAFLERGADGVTLLPAASMMEMVRVAVGDATSDQDRTRVVAVEQIEWHEPLIVGACTEVCISLEACEDEGIAFDIHSRQADSEVTHARGTAYLGEAPVDLPGESQATTLAQSWDGLSYHYAWEPHPHAAVASLPKHQSVLIVCSGDSQRFDVAIRNHYEKSGASQVLLVRIAEQTQQVSENEWHCGVDDATGFQSCLRQLPKIDALFFLAMTEEHSLQANEVQLLRLVKALKASQQIDGGVDTYLLAGEGGGAGIAGLGYSLAQGNYQFRVRNLAVSGTDRAALLAAVLAEGASDRGEVIKIDGGERYRRTFFRLGWPATSRSGIRHNGVYLILGGIGVVGRAITRNLIEKYDANVVWLGRSPQAEEKVQTALQSLASFGDKLTYVQADTLRAESLQRAVATVKARFGAIHGAVFSAMVFGIDDSIEHIPEADFRSIVNVKALGSILFHEAFQGEPLDFMCYFSSGQAYSFSGAAKVCGYAAGITCSDSLVRSLQKTSSFAVGTINWGAWESFVRERLSRMDGVSTRNMGSFEDREGFACFENFVSALQQGSVHQVLCMRASPEVQSLMNCDHGSLAAVAGTGASRLSLANAVEIPDDQIARLQAIRQSSQLDEWFLNLLFQSVTRLVELSGATLPVTVAELCQRCGIIEKYVAWMDSTVDLFIAKGYVERQDGVIRTWRTDTARFVWDEWRTEKQQYVQDPDTKPLVALVEECLQRLADILCGRIAATDVIFPNSSMAKVAPLYKDNATADTFNEIVANAVVAYLEQRLQLEPRARLRILEIGAGTGGTSAAVFRALKPHRASVEEYCYTDLSKAFFFHAQEHYLPENPYLVCRRLDIEKPIEAQGIEAGSYDLVIATNVLHATRNIRETLRNCKAAMRAGGFIMLNEMSHKSLSTHLTFAMLDGWWLFQDPELRIPGCPGLYPEGWQRALKAEGFCNVLFPAEHGHDLGNQIVIARSDGLIRQQVPVAEQVKLPNAAPATEKPVVTAKPNVVPSPTQDPAQFVRGVVLGCLSSVLKIAPEAIDAEVAFADYGIDSILGVSFVDQLNARLSTSLNTAVIFEHSSVERLARHVLQAHAQQIEAVLQSQAKPTSNVSAPSVAAETAPRKRTKKTIAAKGNSTGTTNDGATVEIAVIGMSGKFPKAQDIGEFWRNLVDGVDGVEELPDRYLDPRHISARKQKGKTRCKWGGVLTERDCFDPLFFNLSPREALSMNPHQRLVMQESWNALEDAGLNPKALSGTRTGIFVGSEPTGYAGETFTGVSDAIIASRLSYVLNLRGPAFVVNTGCSASAVALHLACDSLRNRESDLALAGGVNACMRDTTQITLDEIDMLSPSGRCFTFDKSGDGTIISEGVAMVVLKRLDDALADGDPVYGCIVASGINQDGASNGITAPNGESQEQLIRAVYDKFAVDPTRITYVEAHGTGTKLGDPIETNALVRAFRSYTQQQAYCALGSAKSHIGHAAAAAGVIGLVKVLLSMQHRTLPKLLNFRDLNPLIELAGSPFYITTERSEWQSPPGVPRMAALNSFGHSGTNVHIVIKEHLQTALLRRSDINGDLIIPLSAKTKEQLRQRSAQLLQLIQSAPETISLGSLACTLQIGREAMDERVAFVAGSARQLADQLRAYSNGETGIAGMYEGHAKAQRDTPSEFRDEAPGSVARRWVQGQQVIWSSQWRGSLPERMHLPGYPFAKERYWIDATPIRTAADNERASTDDTESIEDIIERIASESLAAHEGVKRLRSLV